MKLLKKILDKKSPWLFFIKFLTGFCLLYVFFPFYWGLTGKGGLIYSATLDKNVNLIKAFTTFLTNSARLILEAANYQVFQRDYHSLRIGYSRGISVNPECLGWAVMSFWIAFVFANRGSGKHKTKWICTGVVSIILLNIIRIALIALANHLDWKTITTSDPHKTFNIFSYGCIFILMLLYIQAQKKAETFDFKQKQQNPVSAV